MLTGQVDVIARATRRKRNQFEIISLNLGVTVFALFPFV